MADTPGPVSFSTDARPAGYDLSRVHVGGVFWFILGFIVTMVILLALVWGFQIHLLPHFQTATGGAPTILLEPLAQPLQPSPGHPTLPWQDMALLRAAQENQLHTAGPLPHDPAHFHIPIDRAMEELLRSGILAQPWKNPTTQPYQRPPTETAPSIENRT